MHPPIDFKLRQDQADRLIKDGNYKDALALAERLIASDPPVGVAVNLHWTCAQAQTALGRLEQAEAQWTRVLAFVPDDVAALAARADVRERMGDPGGARIDRARADELRLRRQAALRRTAAHPVWDRVTDLYNRAAERHPGVKARGAIGVRGERSNGRTADWDHVMAACTRAIARNPRNPLAHYRRAFVHHATKNWDGVIADCTRAMELNRQYADAYNLRAAAYDKKGDLEKAVEDWTRVLELDPANIRAYTLRGLAYEELGNETMAAADRVRAYELSNSPGKR